MCITTAYPAISSEIAHHSTVSCNQGNVLSQMPSHCAGVYWQACIQAALAGGWSCMSWALTSMEVHFQCISLSSDAGPQHQACIQAPMHDSWPFDGQDILLFEPLALTAALALRRCVAAGLHTGTPGWGVVLYVLGAVLLGAGACYGFVYWWQVRHVCNISCLCGHLGCCGAMSWACCGSVYWWQAGATLCRLLGWCVHARQQNKIYQPDWLMW